MPQRFRACFQEFNLGFEDMPTQNLPTEPKSGEIGQMVEFTVTVAEQLGVNTHSIQQR